MLLFQDPLAVIGILVALVVGITFHEFTHAYIADQLGDHRPRAMGRVSLNPAAHIEPLGALMFVLVGFGWGKPVPVNVYALRPGRIGMAVVAAGGPIANLVVATAFAAVFRALEIAGIGGVAQDIIFYVVYFNIVLAIFNLIPIPPLDGYNVVLPFLPPRTAYTVQRYAQWGFVLLLLLVFLPGSPLRALLGLGGPITDFLIGA